MKKEASMSIFQVLFSFEGRIPRSTFWLIYVLPFMAINTIMMILDYRLKTIGVFSGIFAIASLYPSLAVYVKRCHDRGRSGWFVLLLCIPILNLWPAIEIALLRGTKGSNQYGDDPLKGTMVDSRKTVCVNCGKESECTESDVGLMCKECQEDR